MPGSVGGGAVVVGRQEHHEELSAARLLTIRFMRCSKKRTGLSAFRASSGSGRYRLEKFLIHSAQDHIGAVRQPAQRGLTVVGLVHPQVAHAIAERWGGTYGLSSLLQATGDRSRQNT